jgi:hypothetical protein
VLALRIVCPALLGSLVACGVPEKTIGGWEGRTIYFIKGGQHPEWWTSDIAYKDAIGFGRGNRAAIGGMFSGTLGIAGSTLSSSADGGTRDGFLMSIGP